MPAAEIPDFTAESTYIDQIRGKHAQMLVEELNLAGVDSLGDLLSDLMRAASLNHVQASPAVLRLCTGGGAHEEGVLELSLQVVLLDVVCQGSGDFPIYQTPR